MRRGKPPREHRWLSRRRRASLDDVGDVAQRSHAAVDGRVSLGRGVERRARVHASGWAAGIGGRAPYLSGGWPALSVARQATRSAASAGHLAELMSNTASALATVRPYVMRGAPRGRGCGTQQESMRRGSREKGMRARVRKILNARKRQF